MIHNIIQCQICSKNYLVYSYGLMYFFKMSLFFFLLDERRRCDTDSAMDNNRACEQSTLPSSTNNLTNKTRLNSEDKSMIELGPICAKYEITLEKLQNDEVICLPEEAKCKGLVFELEKFRRKNKLSIKDAVKWSAKIWGKEEMATSLSAFRISWLRIYDITRQISKSTNKKQKYLSQQYHLPKFRNKTVIGPFCSKANIFQGDLFSKCKINVRQQYMCKGVFYELEKFRCEGNYSSKVAKLWNYRILGENAKTESPVKTTKRQQLKKKISRKTPKFGLATSEAAVQVAPSIAIKVNKYVQTEGRDNVELEAKSNWLKWRLNKMEVQLADSEDTNEMLAKMLHAKEIECDTLVKERQNFIDNF